MPLRRSTGKWIWVPRLGAADTGVGEDSASLLARLTATDNGLGQDRGALLAHLSGLDDGLGSDRAALLAHLTGTDTGIGEGSGTVFLKYFLSGTDDAIGYDTAALLAHLTGSEDGIGSDLAALLVHLTGRDDGLGYDSATVARSPTAPLRTDFTATGAYNYAIPEWSLIIDYALWAGAASGQTGNGAVNTAGKGGKAGQLITGTLIRGVDIPWSLAAITGTVGAGGAQPANSDGAGPTAGANTTAVINGVTQTAIGGSGQASSQNGETAASATIAGTNYTGGPGGTGNGGAGTAPGGAGAGGNGGIFGSRTRGGPGGNGQASFRARQT